MNLSDNDCYKYQHVLHYMTVYNFRRFANLAANHKGGLP